MPLAQIEVSLALAFKHKNGVERVVEVEVLFGPRLRVVGVGVSAAGCPRLPMGVTASVASVKVV